MDFAGISSALRRKRILGVIEAISGLGGTKPIS
jgi:hypothetical protein